MMGVYFGKFSKMLCNSDTVPNVRLRDLESLVND